MSRSAQRPVAPKSETPKESLSEIAARYRAAAASGGGLTYGGLSMLSGGAPGAAGTGHFGTGYGSRPAGPGLGAAGFGPMSSLNRSAAAPPLRSKPRPAGGSPLDNALANAEDQKDEGRSLFEAGQYLEAVQAWRKGIDALEAFGFSKIGEEGRKLAVSMCCNAAQALLKCPETPGAATEMAAEMADKALAIEPDNAKALFRRGCAYTNAQGWALARKDFEKVLRLEPGNDAARRELQKLEDNLPRATGEGLARRQEEGSVLVSRPTDAASAVRMAQKESERFRREILNLADAQGTVSEWCRRFNKIQVMVADWSKHQLNDPEILQDLLTLRGPLFQAMTRQQREDFLCAYDFVHEVQQRHGDEIRRLQVMA